MRRIEIKGSQLDLPRLINDVALAPEGQGAIRFDIEQATVQQSDNAVISIALSLAGRNEAFACLRLNGEAARALAEQLLMLAAV